MHHQPHFLFLGNTSFSGLAQREHALAVGLAKRGYDVTYIEGMPSLAASLRHILRKISSPYAIERGGELSQLPPSMKILTPPMVPTYSRSSITPAFDRALFRRWFETVRKSFDWSATILFVSLPHWWTGFFDGYQSSAKGTIYDKCDSLLVPSRNKRALRVMAEAEDKLIEQSNLITYSAHEMKSEIERRSGNARTLFLPNAVAADFVRRVEHRTSISGGRKRVGFVGAVDERWIDMKLIEGMVRARHDVDFVFVGTVQRNVRARLRAHRNVVFTGALPHLEVAGLLTSFDAAIIPFLENEISRVVNPLKMYEYCAAGIPTVARATPELRHYADLVYLAGSEDEFIDALDRALNEVDGGLEKFRRKFAGENTWDHRIERLLGAIRETMPEKKRS